MKSDSAEERRTMMGAALGGGRGTTAGHCQLSGRHCWPAGRKCPGIRRNGLTKPPPPPFPPVSSLGPTCPISLFPHTAGEVVAQRARQQAVEMVAFEKPQGRPFHGKLAALVRAAALGGLKFKS